MTKVLCSLVLLFALVVTATSGAQSYPTRTVRVLVPYAPGGGSDILGRMLSPKVSEELGQQFVIDNRPGGNATIGTQMMARAAPDGYTLGVVDNAFTTNPSLFRNLPYDALKDFAPVTVMASSPFILLVHPSLPVKTAKELVALAKARPGQLTFASAGGGTGSHLSMELFRVVTGISLIHVPYKGAGPAVTGILSGEATIFFALPAAMTQHVKAGKARALAVTDARRYPGLPDVPTLVEAGIQGVDANPFWGVVAPAGTPAAIIDRLHVAYAKHINAEDMRKRLVGMAFVPVANTPSEFAAFIKADAAKWDKVIQSAGIQAQNL